MFTPEVKFPAGRSDWMHVRNLRSEFLLSLRQDKELNLRTGVTTKTNAQEVDGFAKERNHHSMCFPFATVEFQKADPGPNHVENCYFQVACAAARAISQRLALEGAYTKCLTGLHDAMEEQHLSPFIGYTCIGPATRVWLAYPDRQSPSGDVVSSSGKH